MYTITRVNRMDPALLKKSQAFKERAHAIPVVEKKATKVKVTSESRSHSKPKKKKSSLIKLKSLQTGTSDAIKQAALSGHRSNNPARILKAVVDMLKERYLEKKYDPVNLEEILKLINLVELRTDTRKELYEALQRNTKIHYYEEVDKFIYLPSLGHGVRKKDQLLDFLKDREAKGMGGVAMKDIEEAVPKAAKVVQKLNNEIFRITRGERDKEEILFYNNKEYDISLDEVVISQWRQVSVEGQSEGDIEKYLENVGLGAMQGEGRKRKAPTQQKKSRKKARQTKVLNTHLATGILLDYTEDGTQITSPTE